LPALHPGHAAAVPLATSASACRACACARRHLCRAHRHRMASSARHLATSPPRQVQATWAQHRVPFTRSWLWPCSLTPPLAAPLRLAGRAHPALVHLVQAIIEPPPFPSCPRASGYRNPRCLLSARPSVIEDFRRHSVSPPSPASRFNGARQRPSSMCALPIEQVPRHLLSAAQLMPPSSGHLVDGSSPAPFSRRRCRLVSVSRSAKAYPSPFQYRDASLITHWSC
jgi:hypothetical protein